MLCKPVWQKCLMTGYHGVSVKHNCAGESSWYCSLTQVNAYSQSWCCVTAELSDMQIVTSHPAAIRHRHQSVIMSWRWCLWPSWTMTPETGGNSPANMLVMNHVHRHSWPTPVWSLFWNVDTANRHVPIHKLYRFTSLNFVELSFYLASYISRF